MDDEAVIRMIELRLMTGMTSNEIAQIMHASDGETLISEDVVLLNIIAEQNYNEFSK